MYILLCPVLFTLIAFVNGELCYNVTQCAGFESTAKTHCQGTGWSVSCSSKGSCTCSNGAVTSLHCQSQVDCERSAAQMHCSDPLWTVTCTGNNECTCRQEQTCSTDTDCAGAGNHHCPFHGRWGCHTVGHNRRCSCSWHKR